MRVISKVRDRQRQSRVVAGQRDRKVIEDPVRQPEYGIAPERIRWGAEADYTALVIIPIQIMMIRRLGSSKALMLTLPIVLFLFSYSPH